MIVQHAHQCHQIIADGQRVGEEIAAMCANLRGQSLSRKGAGRALGNCGQIEQAKRKPRHGGGD